MDACTNQNPAAHQDAHAYGNEIADTDTDTDTDTNPYTHGHGDQGAAHVNTAAPAASTTAAADGYTDGDTGAVADAGLSGR